MGGKQMPLDDCRIFLAITLLETFPSRDPEHIPKRERGPIINNARILTLLLFLLRKIYRSLSNFSR